MKEAEKIVSSSGGQVVGLCLLVLFILFPTVAIPLVSLWAFLFLALGFLSIFLPVFIRSGNSRLISSIDSLLSFLWMPLLPLSAMLLVLGRVLDVIGFFSGGRGRSGGSGDGGGFGGFGGGSFGGGGTSGSW